MSTNNIFIASSLSVFVGWVARDTYYRGMRLWISSIDLNIDNLDRVSIPTKIVATFDAEHPILGTTNEHPKSVVAK